MLHAKKGVPRKRHRARPRLDRHDLRPPTRGCPQRASRTLSNRVSVPLRMRTGADLAQSTTDKLQDGSACIRERRSAPAAAAQAEGAVRSGQRAKDGEQGEARGEAARPIRSPEGCARQEGGWSIRPRQDDREAEEGDRDAGGQDAGGWRARRRPRRILRLGLQV
eukprot:3568955-Prymnesium_polylepis.1